MSKSLCVLLLFLSCSGFNFQESVERVIFDRDILQKINVHHIRRMEKIYEYCEREMAKEVFPTSCIKFFSQARQIFPEPYLREFKLKTESSCQGRLTLLKSINQIMYLEPYLDDMELCRHEVLKRKKLLIYKYLKD